MESKTNKPSQRKLCYCKWQSNVMGKIQTQPSINKRVSSNSNSGNKNNNNKNCHNAIQWKNTKWSGKEREAGVHSICIHCMYVWCKHGQRMYSFQKKKSQKQQQQQRQPKKMWVLDEFGASALPIVLKWSNFNSFWRCMRCINAKCIHCGEQENPKTMHITFYFGYWYWYWCEVETATCINDSWCSGVVCRLQD